MAARRHWPTQHSDRLLIALYNEAIIHDRLNANSFEHAVTIVNEIFGKNYANVVNHMKTVRGRYNNIRQARAISGVSWDDEMKMIDMDYEQYLALRQVTIICQQT